LESGARAAASDLHHLREVSSGLEGKVASALADLRAHDTSMHKLRADTESALTQLSKTVRY
jgi:hypothetical protein